MKLFGLIGLLVTAVALGLVVWLAYGKRDATTEAPAAASATLGAPPPPDVARNAPAAEEYTRRQICLADCAGELRTCKAVAADPSASATCEQTKTTCEARCP